MIKHFPYAPEFGAITRVDATVMNHVLEDLKFNFDHINMLEIGMYDGGTGRGVKNFCINNGLNFNYWAVDSGAICEPKPPFPEANLVIGDSAYVYHQIPYNFNLILIDGCHCINHVILDTVHYSSHAVVNGFMVFHDTSPLAQSIDQQPCFEKGQHIDFHTSVNEALAMIHWPWEGWTLTKDEWEPENPLGGMRSYKLHER